MRRGNRAFLNMQEQAVLFQVSLWLYAVFVSTDDGKMVCANWKPVRKGSQASGGGIVWLVGPT